MQNTTDLVDNVSAKRFEIRMDGHIAILVYELVDKQFRLIHTIVPEALGGHGLGGKLVQAAVARAVAEGLTIIPDCPFAKAWLEKHPDVAATASIAW